MLCPTCRRPARPLFTSCVCDYCDGLIDIGAHVGFVVYRGRDDFSGRPVYVFRTRTDAARWRAANDLRDCPVLEVRSEAPFQWKLARGTIAGAEMADRPFELFFDHRFPPAPYRAYLAPAVRDVA